MANRLASDGQLVAQRGAGPEPVALVYDDEPAEAAAVAGKVKALIAAGTAASEIAVLFRINAQSETYEQAFAEAGVPYVLRGGARFFERPEVRKALMMLRGAARSAEPGDDLVASVRSVLASVGLTAEPPNGTGTVRERWESLMALVRLAEELAAADPAAGLADLTAELDQRVAMQHAPTVQGVTLASLHAAKGLEWDAVFLVGLVDGTVPIVYATTPAQVEEERRLLYVGVTRAREHLTLSWAAARSPGGRGSRQPSRFLDDLQLGGAARPARPGQAGAAGRRATGRPRDLAAARCRVCGVTLATGTDRKLGRCAVHPSDMDVDLFERLRQWRLDRARELKQPAFCVFTDATLIRIAEVRPTTPGELSSISGVGTTKLRNFGDEVIAMCESSG